MQNFEGCPVIVGIRNNLDEVALEARAAD